MMPSILYSDMDGTLISEGAISPENLDALRALTAAAGIFPSPPAGRRRWPAPISAACR